MKAGPRSTCRQIGLATGYGGQGPTKSLQPHPFCAKIRVRPNHRANLTWRVSQMSPEEATLVADMRGRILANVQRNLPPETGITAEELQKVLALTRADQRAAQLK